MAKPSKFVLVDHLNNGGILPCLYRSSFLFLSHLVTLCIILITFMSAVVICCSSLFVKVQHSFPNIRIGLKMVWWMICLAFFGTFLSFSIVCSYIPHSDYIILAILFLISSSCVLCSFTVLPRYLKDCTWFRVWSPILKFKVWCDRSINMTSVFNRLNLDGTC